MSLTNILLTIVVIILAGAGIAYFIKKNKNAEVEEEIEKDEKTYTLKSKKHSFGLGEKVHIVVLRSDLATRRVEFGYLGKEVVS